MTVNCRETRELADSFLSNQLLVETTHEIVGHLEICPACRQELDARRRLRGRLQSAIGSAADLAPRPEFVALLSARLRPASAADAPVEAVSHGRITRRAWLESSWAATWWAAAAAVAALLGGGLFARNQVRRSQLATLAASAAGDHQNCAIRFNLAERPISLEEAADRYDSAYRSLITLEPPAGLPDGVVTVLERHSCVFENRRFAHVVFRYKERVASLLVTRGSGLSGPTPALVPHDGNLRVAACDAGSHAVFVVSDLPERETLQLAEALAGPVARGLTGT